MPVPTNISQLSQTASSNSPAGSESPTTADDYLREYAAYIAQLRDGKGFTDEVDVASATTCDIGAVNSFIVRITGTTTITSLGTTYNGPRFVRFADVLTLTHNASTLVLPGAANITTAAGDAMLCVPNGSTPSGWRVLFYQRAALSPERAAAGANSDITSLSAIASINGGQLAGNRNKIINGKMEIAQRGSSVSVGPNTGAYLLDRWITTVAGASVVTVSAAADVPASAPEFQLSHRVEVTTADASIAAGDFGIIEQRIEGYNIRDLIGKSFTMGFWVRSPKTGVHCIALRNTTPDRSYVAEYTINSVNTWEFKSITVPAGLPTAGTWNYTNGLGLQVVFTMAAGSTFQTTANAWNTGNFLATANQVNCLDTIGNIFAITGVQIEVGSVATAFEHRNFQQEFAMCQRYYSTGYSRMTTYQAAGNNFDYTKNFPVTMRASPTIAFGTPTFTNASSISATATAASGFTTSAVATALGACRFEVSYTATIEL